MAGGELAKRITEMAIDNRSETYKWPRSNYAELSKVVAVRGSWLALRDTAIEAGIGIGRGEKKSPPTVAALRSAWKRVDADMNPSTKQKPTGTVAKSTSTPPDPGLGQARQAYPKPRLLGSEPPGRPPEPASPPRERKPMVLRPARTIGPTEVPQGDGSKLPKPHHRTSQE
jgi:hypothetical protein